MISECELYFLTFLQLLLLFEIAFLCCFMISRNPMPYFYSFLKSRFSHRNVIDDFVIFEREELLSFDVFEEELNDEN